MKIILSILALVLVSVEAQNVSCNDTPNSVFIDIVPIKNFRTFGEQTNRDNWCVGHCDDCASIRAVSVFQYATKKVMAKERIVHQESAQYEYCKDQSISTIVEVAVKNYNNIDDMTTFLKKNLNKAGWAYLFLEQARTTGTVSSLFSYDMNFCYMTVSKAVTGLPDRKFALYSGLVKV